jgi:hypothetical protein
MVFLRDLRDELLSRAGWVLAVSCSSAVFGWVVRLLVAVFRSFVGGKIARAPVVDPGEVFVVSVGRHAEFDEYVFGSWPTERRPPAGEFEDGGIEAVHGVVLSNVQRRHFWLGVVARVRVR